MDLWWLMNSLSFAVIVLTVPFNVYYLYFLIKSKPEKSVPIDNPNDENIKTPTNLTKRTYRGSICGISLFAISSASYIPFFIVFCIYYASTGKPEKPVFMVIWDALGLLCYFAGIWFMLFTFLLRIDNALLSSNNALLRYPTWCRTMLYVYIAIVGIVMVLGIVLYGISARNAVAIVAPLGVFLIISFDITLLYLLFRKLFRIFIIRGTTNALTQDNDSGAQVIELDTLQTTTRYSALILLGVVSTFVFLTLLAVEQALFSSVNLPGGVLIGLDIFVNATALFLMFAVNKDKYNKYCSKYHLCLLSCCINCTYKGERTAKQSKEEYANLVLNAAVVL